MPFHAELYLLATLPVLFAVPPGNSSKNTKAEKKRNVVKIHELTGLSQGKEGLQNRQIWPIG